MLPPWNPPVSSSPAPSFVLREMFAPPPWHWWHPDLQIELPTFLLWGLPFWTVNCLRTSLFSVVDLLASSSVPCPKCRQLEWVVGSWLVRYVRVSLCVYIAGLFFFFWIHVFACRPITLPCTMMRRKMWSQAWSKRPCTDGPTGITSSRPLRVNTPRKGLLHQGVLEAHGLQKAAPPKHGWICIFRKLKYLDYYTRAHRKF